MVKIISDSTCDLSQELLRKYEIDILPLHILLGDKEYEDGKNITSDQIYTWSDANKTTPKTSAPALADAMELFRPYVEAGREIVCFSISAGMSTSGNVMRLAAEELGASDRIKVIDTLTYLYRGGRCNAVAAMAGGVLKLHPRIVVENGAMNASKKYRGKIDSVIMDYVKDMEKDLKNARPERVFITHSGCKQETVEKVRAYMEELDVFDEILETRAGGVISSHCGPGTLGVLYIAK